jgi:hypothetical protein
MVLLATCSVLGSHEKTLEISGVWTKGLLLAQQVLYHFTPPPALLGLGIFKLGAYQLFAPSVLEL